MDETLRLWGSNIRRFRELHQLTQDEVAREIGVGQPTVARWESGLFEPTRRHKVLLAEVLHTDVAVIFPLTRSAA